MKPVELDIVTPASRMHFMPLVIDSIVKEREKVKDRLDIMWWVVHDCKNGGPCAAFDALIPKEPWIVTHHLPSEDEMPPKGWRQRIWHLDNGRPTAYVWWYDDDNTMHPDHLTLLASHLKLDGADRMPIGVVFSMQYCNGKVLQADPLNMRVGAVGGAMPCYYRPSIGTMRPPIMQCGDGHFIEAWIRKVGVGRLVFDTTPVILANNLDPVRSS